MKPKLKVGDYAEVIADCFLRGQILKIEIVNPQSNYPYKVSNDAFYWNDSELRKATKYNTLPDLTDLEQYRLSLEVHLQFIDHFYTDMSVSDYGTVKEYLSDKEWQHSTRETITEILTP